MITYSPEETIEFGLKFAKKLKGGEVIGLIGELGSGKTTFIKGLAEGLRVDETITSPTFVILKPYQGRIADPSNSSGQVKKIEFVHIDAYRIESIDDIKSVGIEDYFERSEKQGSAKAGSYLGRNDVIVVVEWAEKIRNLTAGRQVLPKNTIYINFKHKKESVREITVG